MTTARQERTERRTPPPRDVLERAAMALEQRGVATETGAALLAAALPDGQLLGVHAHAADGQLRWRGQHCAAAGAASVAEILAAGAEDADRWHWPEGDQPQRWIRHVRSGSRVVAWGSRAILGGPRITYDPSLTAAQRDAVVDHVAGNGRRHDRFAVLETDDGAVLCSGGASWCHATPSTDTSGRCGTDQVLDATAVRFAAAELVRNVAGTAVAGVVEGEDPDRFEVHTTSADGARICVPVQLRTDGTTNVGATVAGAAGAAACAPDGWVVAGIGVDGDVVVARGGICAQLR